MSKTYVQRQQFGRRLRHIDGDTDTIVVKEGYPVRSGLSDQFSLKVSNLNQDPVRIALLSGHYDTSSYILKGDKIEKTLSNPSELRKAGYNVDACIDDNEYVLTEGDSKGGYVKFTASDPSKTIRSFQKYIKTNPRSLKGLQIVANDQSAFDTTMTVSSTSPFSKNAEKDIFLNDFFSAFQYQNDRILVDFSADQLELSDISLLIVTIPGSAEMKFNLRF